VLPLLPATRDVGRVARGAMTGGRKCQSFVESLPAAISTTHRYEMLMLCVPRFQLVYFQRATTSRLIPSRTAFLCLDDVVVVYHCWSCHRGHIGLRDSMFRLRRYSNPFAEGKGSAIFPKWYMCYNSARVLPEHRRRSLKYCKLPDHAVYRRPVSEIAFWFDGLLSGIFSPRRQQDEEYQRKWDSTITAKCAPSFARFCDLTGSIDPVARGNWRGGAGAWPLGVVDRMGSTPSQPWRMGQTQARWHCRPLACGIALCKLRVPST
jgi:hypothetical protein